MNRLNSTRIRYVHWLCLLLFASALHAQNEPAYEIAVAQNEMVTMRDGIKLATDIYRPARNGSAVDRKFPVLLERTPYNKDGLSVAARHYVPHGYIVIAQDVRGRYKSQGRWRPIRDDPNDGFDTAKWIGTQPWFDGSIGTMGASYDGATQHAIAIANAPYIKAMVPRNAMSDFGRYGVRHNGAFELRFFNWVLTLGNPSPNGTSHRGGPTRRHRSGGSSRACRYGHSRTRLCTRPAFASRHNAAQVCSRLRVLADPRDEPRRL